MAIGDLSGDLRVLRREPLFAATTILLVAFGVGAATTLTSAARHFVLRPLPGVERQAELVNLHRTTPEESFGGASIEEYRALASSASALVGVASMRDQGILLSAGGEATLVVAQVVSGNYFDVLRSRPTLGRLLTPADDLVPGAHPVVVLDHGLWSRRFGADPTILGRELRLNGRPFTVVGVGPERFSGTFLGFRFDLFVPLSMLAAANPPLAGDPGAAEVELVARRRSGLADAALDVDLARLGAELRRLDPVRWRGAELRASPATGVEPSLRGATVMFFAAIGAVAVLAVLAIAANLASLLLARNATRQHELAVRAALGAGRRALLRTLAMPALVLFALGGIAGTALSLAGARALAGFAPRLAVPIDFDLAPELSTLAGGLALSLALGVAVSLFTALRASHVAPVAALRGARGAIGAPGGRWRAVLVAAQIGIAALLLVPAALFVASALGAAAVDPGFRIDDVATTQLEVGLLGLDAESESRLVEGTLARLGGLPGIEATAAASRFPLGFGRETREIVRLAVQEPVRERVDAAAVSSDYFALLDIPVLAGRVFSAADRRGAALGVIVNEAAARAWWPGADAVGRAIEVEGTSATVVGIVRDGRTRRPWEPARPALYLALAQQRSPRLTLAVRSALPVATLARTVREAVHAEAPDLAVPLLQPARSRLATLMLPQRAGGAIASVLGGVSALLAALGLYALLAHQVVAARREIGLRIAIGAAPARVVAEVVRRGWRCAAAGLAIGGPVAWLAARLLRPLLPGASNQIPAAIASVLVALAALATLAAWIPAYRASRTDPATVLREG